MRLIIPIISLVLAAAYEAGRRSGFEDGYETAELLKLTHTAGKAARS